MSPSENNAVSACLAGVKCRYDGGSVSGEYSGMITVCPEMLAGFGCPRECAEMIGGDGKDVLAGRAKIFTKSGQDITIRMISGCAQALAYLQSYSVTHVYLKDKSPSCGCGQIYDGTFSGRLVSGVGVFTAMLENAGVKVICVR